MSDSVVQSTRPLPDGLVAQPAGEINFTRSPTLRVELIQLIQQHQPRRLVVDLAQVAYMDSSGVATLVEALQQLRPKGGKLVLCNLQDRVRSIFEIARLDSVFTIVNDEAAAASA